MKKYYVLFLLVAVSSLHSCDGLSDCIINTRPHLPHTDFNNASAGYYYEDVVRSEIRNEPRDDRYWYYYDLVGLPLGLDYDFIGQDLIIYGTPVHAGRYSINVFLEVEPKVLYFDNDWDEDGDQLCSYTDERDFLLLVE